MFTPTDLPRLYGLPCGVDIAQAVVSGLRDRLADAPPQAMARVELIVNAERMAQRVRAAFDAGPPGLLPRIRLVSDCADLRDVAHLPVPVPALRRRLEVMQLVGALLEAQPDLAPRSARYDLADQLVRIYDEMVDEGVSPDVLEQLDTTDQSGHWARALTFLQIVRPFVEGDEMDAQTHMRRGIEARIARWRDDPPDHPVIVAGSTGSRGTTRMLMEAVARLPQGAVILPGVDPHMPGDVWQGLDDALTGEDHPQFRFARVCQALGRDPTDIPDWARMQPPSVARNQVVSLALRPAPVTDQWLRDGPDLPDLPEAMADVTLLEAASPRDEALTIAWRLRHAAQGGETAALVTPDRMLARRVSAALDRWRLVANDSAGLGLHLSAPGRLMRQLGDLLHRPVTAEALIALLKHPLTHAGTGKASGRGPHLLWTRDLELYVRKHGIPFPGATHLTDWAVRRKDAEAAMRWAQWVLAITPGPVASGEHPAPDWVARHVDWAEQVVAGSCGADPAALWAEEEGKALRRVVEALAGEAARAGDLSARDYADMMTALLRGEDVRERVTPHPRIFIWGTIEVRAMGVDLLILAGLNEGSWPVMPAADPWLNRRLRHEAGLLVPDRRVGLSAHDFQQAVAASQVWLTRARRTDEAETVPARWLNRLVNLLQGLPVRNGPRALEQMRQRGTLWQREAALLERAVPSAPADRPAPVPPVASRPARLSVTEIKTLIRDPFAIYAKHVLRLRPLNPLQRAPDYLLRGIVLHTVVEDFIKQTCADSDALRADVLRALARDVLARNVDWPAIRPLWQARVDRMAARFVMGEARRQRLATPTAFERRGMLRLPELGFELVGKLDRIDLSPDGTARVYDYKTGAPPTAAVQKAFDKQLLLEAAMIEAGGIEGMGPMPVVEATYLGLGPEAPEVPAPIETVSAQQTCADLALLIGAYRDAAQGYPSRNASFSARDVGDYDHLARYGEWDESHPSVKTVLT